MKNQVQLIAYVDRFSGGGFCDLQSLLSDGPLAGLFGGVHLLPFFWPIDGADAGFDPIDHTQVDPRLGSWDDVRALAKRTDLMADLIVNHLSSRSPQFTDFRKRGDASSYAFMFLTYGRVFRGWRNRSGAIADLSPAAGPSLHENAPGRWNRAALVDYVHLRTSGYRRPFPAGPKVPG